MAAEEQDEKNEGQKKSGSIMKLLIWFVVVVVSIGGGFAAPLLIAQLTAPASGDDATEPLKIDPNEPVEYIELKEVNAALGNTRFQRYLQLVLSLQVAKSQRAEVERLVKAREVVLRNRILTHIADTSEEDISSQHGQNQLRRELHGFINEILFDDGIERVQDVLYSQFNVQ